MPYAVRTMDAPASLANHCASRTDPRHAHGVAIVRESRRATERISGTGAA